MGFATCGQDGNIYFYDLYTSQDIGERNRDRDKGRREVKFSSVVKRPGRDYQFIAVGNEKIIYTESNDLKTIPRQLANDGSNPQAQLPDLKHHISQLVIHHSGKILFCGVGEQSEVSYPGAIQVWKLPFECGAEIQAHASPITRLRINHSNTHLFSVGQDGMLAIFDVKDRDPKRDPEGVQGALKFSQEILSEKSKVDDLITEEE